MDAARSDYLARVFVNIACRAIRIAVNTIRRNGKLAYFHVLVWSEAQGCCLAFADLSELGLHERFATPFLDGGDLTIGKRVLAAKDISSVRVYRSRHPLLRVLEYSRSGKSMKQDLLSEDLGDLYLRLLGREDRIGEMSDVTLAYLSRPLGTKLKIRRRFFVLVRGLFVMAALIIVATIAYWEKPLR